jgi:hypothetical protein
MQHTCQLYMIRSFYQLSLHFVSQIFTVLSEDADANLSGFVGSQHTCSTLSVCPVSTIDSLPCRRLAIGHKVVVVDFGYNIAKANIDHNRDSHDHLHSLPCL